MEEVKLDKTVYKKVSQAYKPNGESLVSAANQKSKSTRIETLETSKVILNESENTGITREQSEATQQAEGNETETITSEGKGAKKKKKSIYNKRIAFYVKDARYEVIKRIAKKEFNWRNTYKDEEECNIIWSDIGLQPERLQNMKPFQ